MEGLIMKKLLVLFVAIGYCLAGIAHEPVDSWVISKEGRMDCKRILVGSFKARIMLQNGEKLILPIDQINSYSLDGRVFNKVEHYRDGNFTNKKVFMELLGTRDGFCLYKHNNCNLESPHDSYYVYKGDQYCFALDQSLSPKRIKNVINYFSL
jgi:hypothetical protein